MQATSRESLQTVRLWFESLLRDADEQRLWTLGDELASVTTLLSRERRLRRSLADSAVSAEARRGLVDQLFAAQVGRSEEHTSELQSRFDLVCRLLLEQNTHRARA